MISEVTRLLKPSGIFVVLSQHEENEIKSYFQNFKNIKIHRIEKNSRSAKNGLSPKEKYLLYLMYK